MARARSRSTALTLRPIASAISVPLSPQHHRRAVIGRQSVEGGLDQRLTLRFGELLGRGERIVNRWRKAIRDRGTFLRIWSMRRRLRMRNRNVRKVAVGLYRGAASKTFRKASWARSLLRRRRQ